MMENVLTVIIVLILFVLIVALYPYGIFYAIEVLTGFKIEYSFISVFSFWLLYLSIFVLISGAVRDAFENVARKYQNWRN